MTITHKPNHLHLEQPGDYCIVGDASGDPARRRVILKCPFCGTEMSCSHTIVSEDPLTLLPSIVGPDDNVVRNCHHHFYIEAGKVKPA